ncbi:MAG: DUF2961 domain-containing protein [Phycisphaerales bacterium]|nr:DUF2961 domain-containing protein [Phycisphaerales bacterium]
MVQKSWWFATAVGLLHLGMASAQGQQVSFTGLLEELVDRGAVARVPEPWYTCRQASSYDRHSVSSEDTETWFANGDVDQFERVEDHAGRREWVMMDVQGPGAVVRIWSANPKGNMRIYLDGADAPAIEGPMTALLGGDWSAEGVKVGHPISQSRSKGWNLYLPIPYASSCRITSDAPGFYYQVNYRTYEEGTSVESYTAGALKRAAALLGRVQERLGSPWPTVAAGLTKAAIGPGGEASIVLPAGPHAVRDFVVKLDAGAPRDALRNVVVEGTFDGEQTVWAPLGDFFLSGPLPNKVETWVSHVDPKSQVLRSGWLMPYESAGTLLLHNYGSEPVTLAFGVASDAWTWDERSMHFVARWRQEDPIHTRPMRDWNYVEATGEGVYVGDTLSVSNPVTDWWGEGDEKIYVDGEDFPSHFGTGTEDYYGYAWCCPEPFNGPFHAQPRCDGPGNYGHTTVARVRLLDGIPFTKSIKTDIEVWHWAECDITYAATTFLYMRPGGATNRPAQPEEAAKGVVDPAPLPPPFRIPGAVEAEELEVVGHSEGLAYGPQDMMGFGRDKWSGNTQLWMQGRATGDYIELKVPAEGTAAKKLTIYATKSWDYGIVSFTVNGERAGTVLDAYSGRQGVAEPTGPVELGTFAPRDGAFVIRAEVVGGNPASQGTKAFFGLDAVVVGEAAK